MWDIITYPCFIIKILNFNNLTKFEKIIPKSPSFVKSRLLVLLWLVLKVASAKIYALLILVQSVQNIQVTGIDFLKCWEGQVSTFKTWKWYIFPIQICSVEFTIMVLKICYRFREVFEKIYINGLVQEIRNSIANALELRLSCTNPSL